MVNEAERRRSGPARPVLVARRAIAAAGLLVGLVALAVSGCGQAATTTEPTTPGTLAPEREAAEMLDWLDARSMGCVGPFATGLGDAESWRCHPRTEEGAAQSPSAAFIVVHVTAGAAGILEVSAMVSYPPSASPDIDETRGFLVDTIGRSPAIRAAGPLVDEWIAGNLETGAESSVGRLSLALTPFGRTTELRAFFVDRQVSPTP